jgi:nucleolin
MKLFSFGPDIEEAEGGGLETQEEAYERARLAQRPQKKQKSDKKEEKEETDEKREKRREKKRKANAKKLAKKHAALGTTPNSSVSTGKVRGAAAKKKSDSSSSESEEEHAKVAPAAPAPKTYFDPFSKKRIVIGSGSAAAMGDKQSQAADKQSSRTAVAAAPNGKLDALSDARAHASKRRKGAGKSGRADTSSSSSSESSEDEQENKPAAKPPAQKTYFDPFATKKRVVIGGGSTSASGQNADTAQEKRAKTNGEHEIKQRGTNIEGQTKEANNKSNTKGVAKSRCSETESSASSDDESEEDATAHSKPSQPAAPPKSFYDPFSKTRITVGAAAAAVPAAAAAAAVAAAAAAAGDKRARAASTKPAASTSKRQQGAGNASSSSSSDSSSSSEEEGGQEGGEKEGTTTKNKKNPGPTSAAPKSYYDPFSKKRISVISVGPGAGDDATAGILYYIYNIYREREREIDIHIIYICKTHFCLPGSWRRRREGQRGRYIYIDIDIEV